MTDLSSLYQDLILDHNRSPRNFRVMDQPDRSAEGYNPTCGDQLTLWLKLDGERIADASFQGNGCAVSRASASLMTGAIKGKTRAEALEMLDGFQRLITGAGSADRSALPAKLSAFAGVADHPSRVKCAGLAWHALKNALKD
jgi:nitrogen fixation NifU-like protein